MKRSIEKNRQQETKCEWCNKTIVGKALLCSYHIFYSGSPKRIFPHGGEKNLWPIWLAIENHMRSKMRDNTL